MATCSTFRVISKMDYPQTPLTTFLNVLDFGAVNDGSALTNTHIQAAIDAVQEAGGGRVIVPPGRYLCGAIRLCSNLTLEIQPGARLVASGNMEDFVKGEAGPPVKHKDCTRRNFLFAENAESITITGGGIIDGEGENHWSGRPDPKKFWRAKEDRVSPMVNFVNCRNLRMDGIHLVDSPGWTCHLPGCHNVVISGVEILNNLFGPNTDGFDITDSADVFICNCRIVAGDDAIVLKSFGGTCERIVVTNCSIQLHNVHMTYPRVEDDLERGRHARDRQYSAGSEDARMAPAFLVAKNIEGLILTNVEARWPKASDARFHFLWARNVCNGFVDCPMSRASREDVEAFQLDACRNLAIRK